MLYTHPHIYTLPIYAHTEIYMPLGNLRKREGKTRERGGYWWFHVSSKTNVDLMEVFRGCCLSRRREAEVLRKDSIDKCLEDRKDAQTTTTSA